MNRESFLRWVSVKFRIVRLNKVNKNKVKKNSKWKIFNLLFLLLICSLEITNLSRSARYMRLVSNTGNKNLWKLPWLHKFTETQKAKRMFSLKFVWYSLSHYLCVYSGSTRHFHTHSNTKNAQKPSRALLENSVVRQQSNNPLQKKMPKYTLTYFDIQALGEPIRMLLSYGNLEFTDNRIDYEKDWAKFKAGEFETFFVP